MYPDKKMYLDTLARLSNEQIKQAGQRYTPGIDKEAPNLRIESLFTAIENVACGASALARFQKVLETFSVSWRRAKHCSQLSNVIQELVDDTYSFLPKLVDRMRERDKDAGKEWLDRLSDIESALVADVDYWRAEDAKMSKTDNDGGYYSDNNHIRGNINAIGNCLAIVREEVEFIESPSFKVLIDPNLLVVGEWGTGKTHLMCDVTQERISNCKATILMLAKNFEGNVVKEICSLIEDGRTQFEIFDRLEDLAKETKERLIIILDGVNEGRRKEWREAVSSFQALVEDRSNIGLIITCRTPFEAIAIDQKSLDKFHKVKHFGFDDQEFDAQAAFFQYYNLPLPEVPLLDREFSRPLTLKLICLSLKNLTGNKLAQGFAGIASGQKGMTYVLESFVKVIGRPIEQKYGLKNNGCWELLKGNNQLTEGKLSGLAPCMAANLRGYVLRLDLDRIISANYPALKPVQRRQLLEELRTSGLIEEDAVWYISKSGVKVRVVYRLPYQRFSDHLVARHLLKTYLDVSSYIAIKRSFMSSSPLARIFRTSRRNQRNYAEPGWAQALITELPERVGKRLPSKERELFFVLPKQAQNLSAYFDPFIEGFFWRDPLTFTEGTRAIINQYLNAGSYRWRRMVDALAAVSTKPNHPYHARLLYNFLAKYPMPERDLEWSEFLRKPYSSPTIHRLLTWADKFNPTKITQQTAEGLTVLLSLVLTSVVRSDRDLATKALVMIGERFPEVLFTHVETSLTFNDPYLPERMLASAYGTTLSQVDSEMALTFRPLLGKLAKILYRKMFGPNAKCATHHALMRDYALGIIHNALRVNCVTLPKTANIFLASPFQNTPSRFACDDIPYHVVKEAIGNPIHMDFGNYTIGRLIPNRSNYDNKSPGYTSVREKIERRIFDLGYREEQFKIADKEIGNTSWHADNQEKVDRYAKKYSWIAYFEMWGEREVLRKLPDWRLGERTSDCGVDPTFPKPPPDWIPPIPDLFGDTTISTQAWVEGGFTPDFKSLLMVPRINEHHGEWVLLEGHIRGEDTITDREIFAYLRGLFISSKDASSLREKFLDIESTPYRDIPEGATERYLFAGEAGRRHNYVRHLCKQNGQYRRQTARAYDTYERLQTKQKFPFSTLKIKLTPSEELEIDEPYLELFGLGPFSEMRLIPGIRIELPNVNFGWESYHSAHNSFSGFNLPSPSLIQRLGLASKNREIDFYDLIGKPGTLYRMAGDGFKGNQHSLLYIRADLLRRYLRDTRQVLVWCNWGERDWLKKMHNNDVLSDAVRQRIYESNTQIHRSFYQWSAKDSKLV